MRLYSGTSTQFIADTTHNQIAEKLKRAFSESFRYGPPQSEVNSWRNSLRAVSLVFQQSHLTDHGVILEYQLPLTSRRLDCLVTGKDGGLRDNAVIIELKQWEECEPADGDNEVITWVGGAEREVLHPSVQVGQYRMYLQDGHTAFYEGERPILLNACSYLHNYSLRGDDVLLWNKFDRAIATCPLFSADDVDPLCDYLTGKLTAGEGIDVLRKIEGGEYRPSKKLMEHVGNVIKGKPEYILLDEQLVVYDKVLSCARQGFRDKKTNVLIIKGGPGTGKSVIAINLMADLLLGGYNAHYATGSRAFTQTLRKIIGPRGQVQFKYFNSYAGAEANAVDVLICDEAHRIRKVSSSRFSPRSDRIDTPQIRELLKAAKVAVFFIDDDQVVRPEEIGSTAHIRRNAEAADCAVHEYELEAQFRCSGSDAFVNWINNTLGIRRTANIMWTGTEEFDFQVFHSPQALEDAIRERASRGFTARMTAGYCWDWSKKPNPDGTLKKDLQIGHYRRPWNARPEATRLARGIPKAPLWAYDPNGMEQVGCVYTAQGFEFDYAGVIIGNDLVYDLDGQEWVGRKENSRDPVVKRSGERFLDLVKNTYRVLLSRGMKGCYVYFLDKDTERFFKSRIEVEVRGKVRVRREDHGEGERFGELIPFKNSLPLLDLRAVANSSYDSVDGYFSDESSYSWVRVEGGPYPEDRFLVRAEGDSMTPRIPDGALCLFRKDPGGSRNGKIILCRIPGVGGADPLAVIKQYKSERIVQLDSIGPASKITLSSLNPAHTPIDLREGDEFSILGIFECVVG